MTLTRAALALAAVLMAAPASADVVSATYSPGESTIANFDASLGTLTQIDFFLTGSVSGSLTYNGPASTFNLIASADPLAAFIVATPTFNFGGPTFGPSASGILTFTPGATGGSPTVLPFNLATLSYSRSVTSAAELAEYQSLGSTIQLQHQTLVTYTISGAGAAFVSAPPSGSAGDLEVRYTYTPAVAPEPSTWALMIGGFGLAGSALRRRQALA